MMQKFTQKTGKISKAKADRIAELKKNNKEAA